MLNPEEDKEMQETPLRVIWKKNGKFLKAKKIESSFNPYKSP